jgi:hypothetical protein
VIQVIKEGGKTSVSPTHIGPGFRKIREEAPRFTVDGVRGQYQLFCPQGLDRDSDPGRILASGRSPMR